MFLEGGDKLDRKDETQADDFARHLLIPPDAGQRLVTIGKTATAVRAFAAQLGIAPGIVVGRMQKDGLLPWSSPLNSLKVRYRWAHEAHRAEARRH